jgi:hypothetical protein
LDEVAQLGQAHDFVGIHGLAWVQLDEGFRLAGQGPGEGERLAGQADLGYPPSAGRVLASEDRGENRFGSFAFVLGAARLCPFP